MVGAAVGVGVVRGTAGAVDVCPVPLSAIALDAPAPAAPTKQITHSNRIGRNIRYSSLAQLIQ